MNLKSTKRFGLVALTVLLTPQDWAFAEGWYASVYGGYAISDTKFGGSGSLSSDELDFEHDRHVGAKLGYSFPHNELGNWRTEFDLSHVSGELQRNGNAMLSRPAWRADVDAYTFIARGLYDFTISPESRWRPYVGIGAGFVSVDADLQAYASDPLHESSKTTFVGEISGGLSYLLTDKIDLFVEMRRRITD